MALLRDWSKGNLEIWDTILSRFDYEFYVKYASYFLSRMDDNQKRFNIHNLRKISSNILWYCYNGVIVVRDLKDVCNYMVICFKWAITR